VDDELHIVKSSSMNSRRKRGKITLLIKRDTNRCWYCWRSFSKNVQRTLDHRLPLSAGGTNAIENLVLSCLECNRRKGGDVKDWETGCFRDLYVVS
jgi:5-methylcytosine-specific restriction endonuclease McrA